MDVGQIFTTRPTSWVIRPQPSAAGNRSIKNSVGTDLAITNFVKFKKKLYLDFLNLLLYTCMLRSDPIYTTLRMDPSQCPTVECCVYIHDGVMSLQNSSLRHAIQVHIYTPQSTNNSISFMHGYNCDSTSIRRLFDAGSTACQRSLRSQWRNPPAAVTLTYLFIL